MQETITNEVIRVPWNKGMIMGQKPPLKRNEIWAIRIHLQIDDRIRDLALFNLAIDSKLRACDLVRIRVRDVTHGDQVASRAMVMQRKIKRPVQFDRVQKTPSEQLPVSQSQESDHAHFDAAVKSEYMAFPRSQCWSDCKSFILGIRNQSVYESH